MIMRPLKMINNESKVIHFRIALRYRVFAIFFFFFDKYSLTYKQPSFIDYE